MDYDQDDFDDVIGDPDGLPPADEHELTRRPGVVSGGPYSEST
ncbi:hypothetical protein AB0L04_00385 [Streptomyces glaucescens]